MSTPTQTYQAQQSQAGAIAVRTGSWTELAHQAKPVRREVFVAEQGIPEHMEWDEADLTALHAVALGADGQVLGTGRLLSGYPGDAPGVGRIGRLAVRRVVRGTGVGDALLQALIHAARQRGDAEVHLSAQSSAEGFYSRVGFLPLGPRFDEAGIPHQNMRLPLSTQPA